MNNQFPTFSSGFAKNPGESLYPHLWNGLVGLWSPELGKQGDKLYDWSGFRHHGTLNGMDAATDYIAGKNGYALNFDGTNDNITCGNIPEIDTASQTMTIMFWIRTTAASNNCIASYDSNDSLSPSVDWYIYNPSSLRLGGFGNTTEYNTAIAFNDGLWHHVAVVEEQTTLILYVDGVVRFTQAITQSHGNFSASYILRFADNSNISHFPGDLGEIRLYRRDLRADEVRQSYLGASPLTPSPVYINSPKGQQSQQSSETLSILDSIEVIDTLVQESETLSILDSINVQDTSYQDSESISITDSIQLLSTNTDASFGVKIISVNPLIFVTDTSPAEIVKVDTTDPENLTWEVQTISGINNATDAVYNSNTDLIYISGEDGQIIKIDFNDLSIQTITDLSDTDDLLKIENLDTEGFTFTSTENAIGELYLLDERNTALIDSDIQVLAEIKEFIDSDFKCIQAVTMDSDIQVLGENQVIMNCDFKCLTASVSTLTPIPRTDIVVFVDSVQLHDTDIDLSTVNIIHNIDNKSQATFKLNRRHDRINTDLQGNTRTITSQNTVRIEIDGHVEFDGKVASIDCNYAQSNDSITVTATQNQPDVSYAKKLLSLAGLTEKLNLFHILVQNPRINNPYIDPTEVNPVRFNGIFVPFGEKRTQSVVRYEQIDSSGNFAEKIQDGTFNIRQNWTYFWSPTVIQPKLVAVNTPSRIGILPSFSSLGQPFHGITTPAFTLGEFQFPGTQATGKTSMIHFKYIGTSLAPVSSDIWVLKHANHRYQRIYEDKITLLGDGSISIAQLTEELPSYLNATSVFNELVDTSYINGSGVIQNKFKLAGNIDDFNIPEFNEYKEIIHEIVKNKLGYYVGSAPYKTINTRNGIFEPKSKWIDEDNGLYSVREPGFDFTTFAQKVADLEYEKLKNINGTVTPETSCSIHLSFDAYYYFGLQLLNRINIDNTTESNIFKNTNGFPVAIKSINISASDMKVIIQCDNLKSTPELEEIDGQFPDELDPEYNESEQRTLVALKTDMNSRLLIE